MKDMDLKVKENKSPIKFIEPRYEHKSDLWLWDVIAHEEAVWSKWEGLGFADYYFVQHKIFKWIKRVKYFGYSPKEHPKYNQFCKKYGYDKVEEC